MLKHFIHSNKGSSIVLFALILSIIMLACALVVDIGVAAVEKQHLQNAIDSAVLAAVADLPDTTNATNTAKNYIVKNGYSTSDVNISFEQNNKSIKIEGTKNSPLYFAKIIEKENVELKASATATSMISGGPFDYSLFSGSTTNDLSISGSKATILGGVHSNKKFNAHMSEILITDTVDTVSSILITGSNITVPYRNPYSEYVGMPDFSNTIKQLAENAGNVINNSLHISQSNFNVDDSLYINGDLQVSTSSFTGGGCILAEGNIQFSLSELSLQTADPVCFYSHNGDIEISGSNIEIHGILYAPNGTIRINCSELKVYGKIIANEIQYSGSILNIETSDNDLKALPSGGKIRLIN